MITIYRKDLYEKIWSVGITKAAKELNVPYDKLKKVCIANAVPLPTASYWSSLHLGNVKPIRPSLPTNDNPKLEIENVREKQTTAVKIISEAKVSFKEQPVLLPLQPKLEKTKYFSSYNTEEQQLLTQIYNSLKVNKTLSSKPHQEIVKYRKKDNASFYNSMPKLNLNSSSGQIIPEALPLIDSLFKALENAGAKINMTREETQVVYKHYCFTLAFKIPSYKVNFPPNDKRYSTYNTFEYVATGRMNIEVGYRISAYKWSKHEKLLKQSEKESFDDLLKKVFLYIFTLPEKIDLQVHDSALLENQQREEQKRQAMLKKRYEDEYQRTEELLNRATHYYYSQLIENYINTELDETTEEYKWALNKSNWMKDSEKNPDSVLRYKDKEKLIKNRR